MVLKIMKKMAAKGIQLSMDDFGTGYSSLGVLNDFPLNELKIDRSFVMDIPENQNHAAICKTIIRMADALKVNVVAEGVETLEQLEFLKNNRCYLIQGYYFYKPMDFSSFRTVLEETPMDLKT